MENMKNWFSPTKRNPVVEKGLDLRLQASRAKRHLKWGCAQAVLLAILLIDINDDCRIVQHNWHVALLTVSVIVGLCCVNSFLQYFIFALKRTKLLGTESQRTLLDIDENDGSFLIASSSEPKKKPAQKQENPNVTILSWHSSFNNSLSPMTSNVSYSPKSNTMSPMSIRRQLQWSPGQKYAYDVSNQWNSQMNSSYMLGSSPNSTYSEHAAFFSPYSKSEVGDSITDEQQLETFLKEASEREMSMMDSFDQSHSRRPMESFWTYCNSAANVLKTSLYQLAPSSAPNLPSKQINNEGVMNIVDSNSEVIKKISAEKLSLYLANLRRWFSATILTRLAKEIDNIDELFKSRGLVDMQMGSIALERLKQTAENQQFVNSCVPMLPMVVPFLDMSSNQEYLVQRIKDLAKGTCIADYRWNSGSTYHGLKWDEHLPTDSAVLFHLFCVYMDSQLMPLPQGGGRPFYNRYVIVAEEKREPKEVIDSVQNRANCAILCTNPLKPKFNFISDKKIHNCAYDRNNLFYVIIQFLIYMKTHHNCSLEGVNLGKSGINILCVIES